MNTPNALWLLEGGTSSKKKVNMSELRQLAYDLPPEDNDEVKYRQALEKQRAEIEDAINYYTGLINSAENKSNASNSNATNANRQNILDTEKEEMLIIYKTKRQRLNEEHERVMKELTESNTIHHDNNVPANLPEGIRNEFKEMSDYANQLLGKINSLKSELLSARLHGNEIMRREKEEELRALEQKHSKLLTDMQVLLSSNRETPASAPAPALEPEPASAPASEPASTSAPEPALEPASAPASEPASTSAPEPALEPEPEPASAPASEPASASAPEPEPESTPASAPEGPAIPVLLPEISHNLELKAVLSDTESIHFERIAKAVEHQMQEEYKKIKRGDIFNKMKYNFTRQKMRKKRINEIMQRIEKTPLSYEEDMNAYLADVAERHQFEEQHNDTTYNENKVTKVAENIMNNNIQLNTLAAKYIQGILNDNQFTHDFNEILANDGDLQNKLDENNVKRMSTNILSKLQEQKAMHKCVQEIETAFEEYSAGYTLSLDRVDTAIDTFLDTYKTLPVWMNNIAEIKNKIVGATDGPEKMHFEENMNIALSSIKASLQMQARNVKIALDIVKGGKDAQHINNANHANTLFKIGEAYDQLPGRVKIGSTIMAGTLGGMAAGGTTAAFAIPGIIVGSVVGLKKYVDYTKEHHNQEKLSLIEQEKFIEKRNQLMTIKGGDKYLASYRANRQLELYHLTMQNTVSSINEMQNNLRNTYKTYVKDKTAENKSALYSQLRECLVCLDFHAQMGHPVLYADSLYEAEKTMVGLKKSLYFINQNLQTDPIFGHNEIRETNEYKNNYQALKQQYKAVSDEFKEQRTILGVKYGVVFGSLASGISWGFSEGLNALNQKLGVVTEKIEEVIITEGRPETIYDIPHNTAFDTNPNDAFDLGENFALGGHESITGENGLATNVYNAIESPVCDGSVTHMNIHYGAGTDGIPVSACSPSLSEHVYKYKLEAVIARIEQMQGLSLEHKNLFLQELNNQPWNTSIGTDNPFSNDALFKLRCLELEHVAEAINNLGTNAHGIKLNLVHDTLSNIAGKAGDNAAERVFGINLELQKIIPGTDATTKVITTYVPIVQDMPVATPLFANTFAKPREEENPIATTP